MAALSDFWDPEGMPLSLAPVLAHQTTWFTTVLAVTPLVFFAWLLHLAKRRASTRHDT